MSLFTVDPSRYDRNYFEQSIHTTLDELKAGNVSILNKIVNMVPLDESDLVVDFGCGSGLLSFSLHERYHCRVLGVDYSQDAINLCNEYNSTLGYKNVSFLRSDIGSLPKINRVKAIYLADVIEHLYDPEIEALFEKTRQWTTVPGAELFVVVHTDNLNYLRFVRGFIDAISLLLRKTSISKLKERNTFEAERHVNLMTLSGLVEKMKRCGYALVRVDYPEITDERLAAQFGSLGRNSLVKLVLKKSYRFTKYLSPSVYCVFKRAQR